MGTASDVGESMVFAALCRVFARAGVRVAPFNRRNMLDDAAVCPVAAIGRAQAVQAQACDSDPSLDMNPVLLKTQSGIGCQVVIPGRARFQMGVNDYGDTVLRHRLRWSAAITIWPDFELIVEGAGSAAIDLRHRDIVNWEIAELADAPVLLVADIDEGGVFLDRRHARAARAGGTAARQGSAD